MDSKTKSSPKQLKKHLEIYLKDIVSIQHPWLKNFNVILKQSIVGPLIFIVFSNSKKMELGLYCIEAVFEQTNDFISQLFDEHIKPYL